MSQRDNKLYYYCSYKKYYESTMSFVDILSPVKYMQFLGHYNFGIFMHKTPYYTKHIDLKQSDELLKNSFSKGVRYKINRATRDKIEFKILDLSNEENLTFYLNYYNRFAKDKKLSYRLSKREITSFRSNFVVTYAEYQGEILVMHGSFIDEVNKTVYIHQSSSQYRSISSTSSLNRNFISNANCFLHHEDMLYFKQRGMQTYDFGGYAMHTQEENLLLINRFKDGFRGELIQQNHYESYLYFVMNRLYHCVKPILIRARLSHFLSFLKKDYLPHSSFYYEKA